MMLRLLRSPLFPYTTLLRSAVGAVAFTPQMALFPGQPDALDAVEPLAVAQVAHHAIDRGLEPRRIAERAQIRSEEHTSELQSPCNLVCRLLLEKKNKVNETK